MFVRLELCGFILQVCCSTDLVSSPGSYPVRVGGMEQHKNINELTEI